MNFIIFSLYHFTMSFIVPIVFREGGHGVGMVKDVIVYFRMLSIHQKCRSAFRIFRNRVLIVTTLYVIARSNFCSQLKKNWLVVLVVVSMNNVSQFKV